MNRRSFLTGGAAALTVPAEVTEAAVALPAAEKYITESLAECMQPYDCNVISYGVTKFSPIHYWSYVEGFADGLS